MSSRNTALITVTGFVKRTRVHPARRSPARVSTAPCSGRMLVATTFTTADSHARVDVDVEHIDHEIDQDVGHGDSDDRALDDRVVTAGDALRRAGPCPDREDGFGDDGAAEQRSSEMPITVSAGMSALRSAWR